MPEEEVLIQEVKAIPTRSGNTRHVLVDSHGREYTTFREEIAASLEGGERHRARIRYHQQTRGSFTNVYLDEVEILGGPDSRDDPVTEEVAWKTAIDAAPYLLSPEAIEQETPAEEVFRKLRPFKQLVADDIEQPEDDDPSADDRPAG